MEQDLIKLYNTLLTIETKGSNTKTMALCLQYLEQLIVKAKETKDVVKND